MTASTRDLLNSNEQIVIQTPLAGLWKVLVETKLLTESDHQIYALVITAGGWY
jgi:hypothetical protein